LIVVDNGSTDETPAVLAHYSDQRVRVHRIPENRGALGGHNVGFDLVEGEWFTVFHDDDEMVPDALEAMLDCAGRTGATAISCNCVDTTTGAFSGQGVTRDCRLSPAATSRLRGEFWGMTKTELLGDLRYDERLTSGFLNTVWRKINRNARRYYLHRGLRVYHTEGDVRETNALYRPAMRTKVQDYYCLGQDRDYIRELRRIDCRMYLRTVPRVWAARVLRPVLNVRPGPRPLGDTPRLPGSGR
jgi:glycosyltransferase involved in cell wall biosynthesis